MNSPRVANEADAARGRHANTIEDASAFDPRLRIRFANSVRIGHVALTCNPESTTACRKVSHPVERESPSLVSTAL